MKKLILFLIGLGATPAFAGDYNAEVMGDSVSASINENAQKFNAGQKIPLHNGDLVCYESGKGKLYISGIDAYEMQLSEKTTPCVQLPQKIGLKARFEGFIANLMPDSLKKSEQSYSDGVSRSTETDNQGIIRQKIEVDSGLSKYVSIESDQWGPWPVTLNVYDDKGELKGHFLNESNIHTSFVLPISKVGDDYTLKVIGGEGQILTEIMIIFVK